MAGNLRNSLTGESSMALSRNNPLIRASMTEQARILYDLRNGYPANGIGGVSSSNDLKYFYSPDRSEILDENRTVTGYDRGDDQEDTALKEKLAVQEMTQSVRHANGMDDIANGKEYNMVRDENDTTYLGQRGVYDNRINSFGLKQNTWNGRSHEGQNGGDHDYSFAPWQTGINGAKIEMMGYSRDLGNEYRDQDFSQFGSGAQILGLSTLQGTADSGMNHRGNQGYGGSVYGLSAGANTFFDWMSKGIRDFVQSDVGRSVSINGMDRPLDKEEWRSGLEAIKQINVRQLTEAAAKIMGILSIVVGGAGIAALNITLGLCVVAQEVQEERRKEKERLEGLNDPKWDEAAIKAELERQVPIWFRNKAMEFFVGEWLGKIAKFITNDKLGRIVIDQSREPFLEWYKRMLIEWNEYKETMEAKSHIDSWTGIVKDKYKE